MADDAAERRLGALLQSRRTAGKLRELRAPATGSVDFSSNDYLGLARSDVFQDFISRHVPQTSSGATGSRLLSGHSQAIAAVERKAASFHQAPASLFFSSGYDANLSLLSCLPTTHDAVVYDELIHASVHDGMRLGRARENIYAFLHNDLRSLKVTIEKAAQKHSGIIWVCIETVYSMDGDITPLDSLLAILHIQSQLLGRQVLLVADEAHAGNLYGSHGQGLAYALGVHHHKHLFARVVTFGKAFAAHGAVILGSTTLIQYLVNYARPFIYSTAPPPHTVAVIDAAYDFAKTEYTKRARQRLWALVRFFRHTAETILPCGSLLRTNGLSPIQGLLVPGNAECVRVSKLLRTHGFDLYPIRSPTVPSGKERIRVIVHAHNTEEEIERMLNVAAKVLSDHPARL